jgi:hypothetical protein
MGHLRWGFRGNGCFSGNGGLGEGFRRCRFCNGHWFSRYGGWFIGNTRTANWWFIGNTRSRCWFIGNTSGIIGNAICSIYSLDLHDIGRYLYFSLGF